MTLRIVLADDHRMFRETLRIPLSNSPDFVVVAEAGTGQEAIAAVAETQPDVLILDVALPDMNGIEVARQVSRRYPNLGIVALSGYAERMFVEEILKAGAHSYVLKSSEITELFSAIHATANGKRFLCTELTSVMLGRMNNPEVRALPPVSVLTPREQEILRLIANGKRAASIASELSIAVTTVEVHRRNIKEKRVSGKSCG